MRGSSEATLSSDLVQLLLRSIATGENSLQSLLEAAGMDPALILTAHQRISPEQFRPLWDEIERFSGDPCFGLHLGEMQRGLPSGHVLFSVMMNSSTLGHALQRYCRYHGIMADVVQPRFHRCASGATVTLEAKVALHQQHMDCIMSVFVSIVRHLAPGPPGLEGQPPGGIQVSFTHPPPEDLSEYRRLLGPAVRFGQRADRIQISEALLEAPIPTADPELLELLESYARRISDRIRPRRVWSARLSEKLRSSLCDGKPSLAQMARQLAVSPRTLQNRLREEGTTYQDVLDQVRQEMATFYLRESPMPLVDIAFLLGYSDQSAFAHSFKKWTGTSPLSFRGHR